MSFPRFIDSLGLKHFKPAEFLISLDRGNEAPPVSLWPNIALTAVVLDELRSYFKRSIKLTSAYRSPAYNRQVGGTARSQHPAFAALDFKVRTVSPQEVARAAVELRGKLIDLPITIKRVHFEASAGPVPFREIETWRMVNGEASKMRFAGGIGVYSSFVHLDTRGINASWRGR